MVFIATPIAILSFFITLYVINPSLFYFRAWEFFDDTVFTGYGSKHYIFYETGDAGRDYLIQRYGSLNAISINNLGNRVGCYDPRGKKSGILMLGDSQLWGSGNSNENTLPQVLCKKYDANIYNGSRLHELNLLRVQEYNFSKIIFTSAERGHMTRYCGLLDVFEKVENQKLHEEDLFLKKDWSRFIDSNIKHLVGYLKTRLSVIFSLTQPIQAPEEDLVIARHTSNSSDLDDDVRCALRLSDFFSTRDIETAFIYFPAQQTILAKKLGLNLDPDTYNFISNANKKMSALKLKSLDTSSCLVQDGDQMRLTHPHDTHLNKNGIFSMAQCIDRSDMRLFILE